MLPAHEWLALALGSGTVLTVCVTLLLEVYMEDEYRAFLLVLLCIALAPS